MDWQDSREVCKLTFGLSCLGSNFDPANKLSVVFHKPGDSSMRVPSIGRTFSRRTHLPDWPLVDIKDTTLSFVKSM